MVIFCLKVVIFVGGGGGMVAGGGGSAMIFCLPVVILWVGRNWSPEMMTGVGKKMMVEDDVELNE